jgi:hypothetical protein
VHGPADPVRHPPNRGQQTTDAIGILPAERGVRVHDGRRCSGAYTQGRHALCRLHHRRELRLVEATAPHAWATQLKGLRLATKAAVEQARRRGEPRLGPLDRDAYVVG